VYEFARGEKATFGVPPTNKRFRADQAIVLEAHFGLVVEFEFIVFQSTRKFCLKPCSHLKFGPDAALENNVSTAPTCLGAVQRKMRVAKQIIRRAAISREDGEPNAHGDRLLSCLDRERSLAESPANPLR
jgi:hypothetical protein